MKIEIQHNSVGQISNATMRLLFEEAARYTRTLEIQDLTRDAAGQYENATTRHAWHGWLCGMRCYERLLRALGIDPENVIDGLTVETCPEKP